MSASGRWREGCVTRARTVAAGIRLIEFAVEGAPSFTPGSYTSIVVDRGGVAAMSAFACLPVEAGYVRVLARERDDCASRFMWALVEGARVRLTKPERRRWRGRAGNRPGRLRFQPADPAKSLQPRASSEESSIV
jgi:hypothetical protein